MCAWFVPELSIFLDSDFLCRNERPSPGRHIRTVNSILVRVRTAFDLFVAELFFCVGPDSLEPLDPIDRIDGLVAPPDQAQRVDEQKRQTRNSVSGRPKSSAAA